MVVRVIVVCEGSTEEQFVGTVLVPYLKVRGVVLEHRAFETSPGYGGGGLGGPRVLGVLTSAVTERPDSYVTTLFDLYGLPKRFPGRKEAEASADPLERAATVERALEARLTKEIPEGADRFFAHIQPYEFESLLFTEIVHFGEIEAGWKGDLAELAVVVQAAESPEHINDGKDTHPSARLESFERYKKVVYGPEVARRIGVERIRTECRHFDGWVSRLESLPPVERSG